MASGLYTADEVRRWLNGQGIKMCKNQFPNIIRNLTYSGKILVRALGNEPEQIVQGLHPALISEELFAKANDVLSGRKRNMDFKSDKINLYPFLIYSTINFLKFFTNEESISSGTINDPPREIMMVFLGITMGL